MKKIIALALVLVLSLSLLVACGDNETESTAAESAAESATESATEELSIIGKWKYVDELGDVSGDVFFEFKADGTVIGTSDESVVTMKYTIDGNNLKMFSDESADIGGDCTFLLYEDKLVINDWDGLKSTYTKVTD